ncbi:MAG: hypothetical protein WC773_02200 [Patescibacteria group bacterium]|jgi:shikimate dehydrogenase
MIIQKLIDSKMLTVASKAQDNPPSLEGLDFFAVGYAAKDYPAQTPRLWNALYAQFGLNVRNIRLIGSPEVAGDVFDAYRNDDRFLGGDVGAGIKDKAWVIVDQIDPLARAMQAINVVVRTDHKLVGYNTDGHGYVAGLQQVMDATDKTILILGGGGTANAIAFAAAAARMKLIILNRTVSKANDLAVRVNQFCNKAVAVSGGREMISAEAPKADVIVSVIDDPHSPLDQFSALGEIELPATPDSLSRNVATATKVMRTLKPGVLISDVALRDKPTATLQLAASTGLKTQDGRPMVLEQAILAFWLVNQRLLKPRRITQAQVAKAMRQIA